MWARCVWISVQHSWVFPCGDRCYSWGFTHIDSYRMFFDRIYVADYSTDLVTFDCISFHFSTECRCRRLTHASSSLFPPPPPSLSISTTTAPPTRSHSLCLVTSTSRPAPRPPDTLPDQNGQYGAANYCIANAVVQIPVVFLIALCSVTPVYIITGMNDDTIR